MQRRLARRSHERSSGRAATVGCDESTSVHRARARGPPGRRSAKGEKREDKEPKSGGQSVTRFASDDSRRYRLRVRAFLTSSAISSCPFTPHTFSAIFPSRPTQTLS